MQAKRKVRRTHGFSLLEILVALAVLLLGLAVVIRMTTLANRESTSADELATVQLACQTLMNELLAANIRPIPTGPAGHVHGTRNWQLSVEQFNVSHAGITGIRIRAVKTASGPNTQGEQYQLIRWVLDTK